MYFRRKLISPNIFQGVVDWQVYRKKVGEDLLVCADLLDWSSVVVSRDVAIGRIKGRMVESPWRCPFFRSYSVNSAWLPFRSDDLDIKSSKDQPWLSAGVQLIQRRLPKPRCRLTTQEQLRRAAALVMQWTYSLQARVEGEIQVELAYVPDRLIAAPNLEGWLSVVRMYYEPEWLPEEFHDRCGHYNPDVIEGSIFEFFIFALGCDRFVDQVGVFAVKRRGGYTWLRDFLAEREVSILSP